MFLNVVHGSVLRDGADFRYILLTLVSSLQTLFKKPVTQFSFSIDASQSKQRQNLSPSFKNVRISQFQFIFNLFNMFNWFLNIFFTTLFYIYNCWQISNRWEKLSFCNAVHTLWKLVVVPYATTPYLLLAPVIDLACVLQIFYNLFIKFLFLCDIDICTSLKMF